MEFNPNVRGSEQVIRQVLQSALGRLGLRLERVGKCGYCTSVDLQLRDILADKRFMQLSRRCEQFTQTSPERLHALHQALLYLDHARVPGDVVECGVWRGGSAMMAALTLLTCGDTERRLMLYDTFEGMPEPGHHDVDRTGRAARAEWDQRTRNGISDWNLAGLEEVRINLASTGFPEERTVFVKGRVEETLPTTRPERIALLRLDTDWHESTLAELQWLFPLLSPGGVLIVDDYGHWRGSKLAVDQYFESAGAKQFFGRIDYTGRIAVKPFGG